MREKHIFHFKQFSIRHQHAAMKVGTDGVLLGAWVNPGQTVRILDIGTGTGLIALMLAQRTGESTVIEAIEFEQHAYEEACYNVGQSPWKNRINVFHQSLQDFSSDPFDLIVCNPPFFYNSMKSPDEKRVMARHADTLPMQDLARHSKRLVTENGKISLILPSMHEIQIDRIFNEHHLYCCDKIFVRTKHNKPVERLLLTYTPSKQSANAGELVLLDEDGNRSLQYSKLTREYYLKP